MVEVVVGREGPELVVLAVLRRVHSQEQVDGHLLLCIYEDRRWGEVGSGGEGKEGRRGGKEMKGVQRMMMWMCSLVPSPLPQNGCHRLEDGLGNCAYIPGAVTSHYQNLECPIRSSEIMALRNNHHDSLD